MSFIKKYKEFGKEACIGCLLQQKTYTEVGK